MALALPRPELDRTDRRDADRGELSAVESKELADRITRLSSEISAATCHMLLAVAEFDRRRAWSDWGSHSCANWLSWKCGLSPSAAQEHVRVARRLAELPPLIEPFARGELSFSKVRAIIRVATTENIESLLELAGLLTAAQLESVTSAYWRVAQTTAAEISGQQHSRRFARWRYQDDGSVLICARLDPEEGAVVISALEAAVLADEQDVSAETPDEEPDDSAETLNADADVRAETSDERAENVSAEKWPELLEVAASSDRRSPWETAAADALVAVAHTFLDKGMPTGGASDRYQVVVHVDEDSLIERSPFNLSEIEGGHIVMPETVRRLSCDSILQPLIANRGQPLEYGRRKRTVSPKLKRALRARDKCCRFPGCGRTRVDAHHVEHWVEGGRTDPRNLVSLCWFHHRLVHEGGFVVKVENGHFRFYRPGGDYLPQVPQDPVPDVNDIVALRKELGIVGCPEGAGGKWDGEALTFETLSYCVDALLLADGLTTEVVEKMRDEYAEKPAA